MSCKIFYKEFEVMLSCLDIFSCSGSSDTMFLVLKIFLFYLSLASWGI